MTKLQFRDGKILTQDNMLLTGASCCCDQGLYYSTFRGITSTLSKIFGEEWTAPPPYYYSSNPITVNGLPANISTTDFMMAPEKADFTTYWLVGISTTTGKTSAWRWNGTSYTELNASLPDFYNNTYLFGVVTTPNSLGRLRCFLYNQSGAYPGIIFFTKYSSYEATDCQEWYWDNSQTKWVQGRVYSLPASLRFIPLSVSRNYSHGNFAVTVKAQDGYATGYVFYDGRVLALPSPILMMINPPPGAYVAECHACEIDGVDVYVCPHYQYYGYPNYTYSSGIAKCIPSGNWTKYAGPFENVGNPADAFWPYDLSLKAGSYAAVGSGRIGGNLGTYLAYNSWATFYKASVLSSSYNGVHGVEITGKYILLCSSAGQFVFDPISLTFLGTDTTPWRPNVGYASVYPIISR